MIKKNKLETEDHNSSKRKNDDLKLPDKIDIDSKEKDENLEKIRKNNTDSQDNKPKERKGFCTNCLIF